MGESHVYITLEPNCSIVYEIILSMFKLKRGEVKRRFRIGKNKIKLNLTIWRIKTQSPILITQ